MLSVNSTGNILNSVFQSEQNKVNKLNINSSSQSKKTDKLEISASGKAFKKIDDFLNLGKPDRLNTDDLNPAEKEEFLKMLSTLLKKGIIGYEILEVNGKPEKHYIVNQIGDERIKGAKLYKKNDYYNSNDRKV
ncbi:MAG TPA: hypothetical protein PL041_11940 [Melioribacteraceae bacterium]|nr:hypothetical protein [Melioribacteraceae bacterium]